MKFKDIVIIIFLSGLLFYAFCHRAGWFGLTSKVESIGGNADDQASFIDSVRFENWIFSSHPDIGLTVTTATGDIIHHIPEIRSGHIEIVTEPDPTGAVHGLVFVRSDCGVINPCFRISPDGELEMASI